MKKLLSLILVVFIAVCCVGCGGTENENANYERSSDPVTICYYYVNGYGVQQYTEDVEAKLNEILKGIEGYENITIELHPYTGSNYQRDFTLAQASGEQIDLVNTYQLDFVKQVGNGDFLQLGDLLSQFPSISEELPSWVMDYGKVYGEQYYIPTYQQAANLTYIAIPTEYLEMYLDTYSKTKSDVSKQILDSDINSKLDFLEDLCYAVRETTGLDSKWINTGEFWATNLTSNIFYNQEYIDTQFGHLILKEGDDAPVYFGYTEDYKLIMERYAGWYQDGLLHPEVATVNYYKFIEDNFLNDESYVCSFITDTCSEEYLDNYLTKKYGVPMTTFRVTDHAYIPSEWEAGGQAIYADCEHPYEAMMIIDLLRTEKGEEFYNTLVYGLEGTHWQWTDKDSKTIETLEYSEHQGGSTSTYCAYKWNTGNALKYIWKNQAVGKGYIEYIENEVNNSSKSVKSPAMGINIMMTCSNNHSNRTHFRY